jgi:hypothetical protein
MLMSKLVACKTCGKEIARSASICTHCGARQGMGGFWRFVTWVFGIFFLLIIIDFGVFLNSGNGGARLPTCASSTAESEVARAMEGAPIGKVLGLKLINITGAKEVSVNDKERRCSGTAHLSNAHTYPISYKFYVDAQDDVMVEAHVKGL